MEIEKMKTQAIPYIFFDQNVMEKMLKKGHQSFQNNVDKLLLDENKKQ